MAKTRKCIACEREYKYCNNCREYASYPTWMAEFDTEACRDIFDVMSGYNMGILNEDKVKEVVDKHNITDFSIFKESIRTKLEDMFKPVVEEKIVVEEPVVEDKVEVVEEEVKTEEQPTYNSYRRRKYNKKKTNTEEANTEE